MKIKPKAILGGFGTWILSNILLLLLTLLKANLIDINHTFYDLGDAFTEAIYYFFQIARFLSFIIVGIVTARIAKENEIRHGISIGIIIWLCAWTITISYTYLQSSMFERESPFTIMNILYSMLRILGCLLGAFIQKRINGKKEAHKDLLENKIDRLGEE